MTDRELLGLAAKAAGAMRGDWGMECWWLDGTEWNPLTDDGDALRLAVKVGMNMALVRLVVSIATVFDEAGNPVADAQQPHGSDPYAATRRAIVRAAAEIGRGKK